MLLILVAIVVLVALLLGKVPKSYPPATRPIAASTTNTNLGGGLDGFESPYLGHTGSWDGKGGAMFGGSKIPDMEKERVMGLRWTFMPVYWSAMEPSGAVDLSRETPPACCCGVRLRRERKPESRCFIPTVLPLADAQNQLGSTNRLRCCTTSSPLCSRKPCSNGIANWSPRRRN